MRIYPKFQNIYNYKNFKARNIILEDSKAVTDFKDITSLLKISLILKKISLRNFDILIKITTKLF